MLASHLLLPRVEGTEESRLAIQEGPMYRVEFHQCASDVTHIILLRTKELMGTKSYSLRGVGEAVKPQNGHVRRVWEILEVREVSGAVDGLSHTLPGWVRVPGTPEFKTKREARTALERLQNQAE